MKLKKENLKFLFLPVAMALTVLIAVILAKDATIKKTLSIANTKTVVCTGSNYANRTSDSVCGTGYRNTGNDCVETPTYTYSCNSGDSGPSNGVCTSSYNATATCTHSATPSGYSGTCRCTNNGYDWVADVSCSNPVPSSTCNIACINNDYAAALSGSCTATYNSSSCSYGSVVGTSCVWHTTGSCPSGWSRSYGSSSCPNGGTVNTSTGKCESTYNAIQTQTGTTYSGNIICSAITYTVTYNKNGTGATGTTANSTHEYDVAKTLTQNGYTWGGHVFNGWNSKADGTGTNYTDKQSVTNLTSTNGATVTLYAKWTTCPADTYAASGATSCTPCPEGQHSSAGSTSCSAITYTVTYDKNGTGATGTTANSTHEYGVAKTLTQNGYTWGGHVFNGWNSKADGTGTNYTDKQSVTNLTSTNGATVTLYAKWTACAAGTYAAAGATSCTSCSGNTISAAGASSCTECGTGKIANSAHTACTNITYTVTYNKNGTGATGTTANSTHEYGVAKTLTQNGYTWGGHVFNGWNSKADGTGTNYTDKQSVTNLTSTNGATVTLYAKWTACAAGTYAAAGATSCTSCSGNTISAAGASSCTECGTGKIANSAHTACTNITYTVTYNKNGTGATGTTANSTHEYGVAKTLTQNGYTWGGHVFNGWNSKADGTGTNYADKQSVTNLASTNGATVTLYAKWTTCAAGTYAAAGATTCSPCTGNTISTAGSSACTECGTGQAANSSHTVCEDTQNDPVTCPAGKYMRSGGTTLSDCEDCPAGTYSTAGSTTCTPCTNNTYASTPGQSSCTPCEENQIANSDHTGCQPRPDDTVTCQAGTYLKANGTTSDDCEICPVGFYCPGGDFVPLDEDQGKNLCPVNHIDGETGTIVQEFCKLKCATGTYKVEPEASMCVACPTGKTSKEHLVNFGEVSPDGTCYADGDIVSPKTGLIEVGGLLIGTLGLGAVVYIVLRKRKIINI